MRIVVLGASGGIGREIVQQGLQRGHVVVAVGRESSDLRAPEGVDVARGSLEDEAFLAATFEGADVVLSALGLRLSGLAPWSKAEDASFLSRSTPAVVRAMKAAGVSRVAAVSAGGVGDSRDQMPGFMKVFIRTTSLAKAYRELEVMERVLRESGLDACCPRPTGLTDEPRTGAVVVARGFAGRATIPRADVAAWMLEHAETGSWPAFAPMITVTGAKA